VLSEKNSIAKTHEKDPEEEQTDSISTVSPIGARTNDAHVLFSSERMKTGPRCSVNRKHDSAFVSHAHAIFETLTEGKTDKKLASSSIITFFPG